MKAKTKQWVLSSSAPNATPSCFDSKEQYKSYMQLKKMSVHVMDHNFCLDCTPEFKCRMLSEGRCEHPETMFITVIREAGRSVESEVEGVSMRSIRWPKVSDGKAVVLFDEN
jgi:hypothetical protein